MLMQPEKSDYNWNKHITNLFEFGTIELSINNHATNIESQRLHQA